MELTLGLTPHRRVVVRPAVPGDDLVDGELAAAVQDEDAFAFVELAARSPSARFPPAVAWFRDLAHLVLSAAASGTARANVAERLGPPPPFHGAEYADAVDEIADRFAGAVPTEGLEEWLRARNPAWAVVGRVCFHLAENKRDPGRPFAFLATCSAGPANSGREQHRPLGQALAAYAEAGDREGLLKLLVPVNRAAESIPWLKEMVDSNALFRPQAWSAPQAWRLLKAAPALEAAGLVVRVPDWWKPTSPPRVQVTVSLGGSVRGTLGGDGVLSFEADFAIDGEPLTAEEREAIRQAQAGLVSLRGRWVEVDQARLDQMAAAWRRVAQEGVSFQEAMRLLAGVERPAKGDDIAAAEWSRVTAGPWLEGVLRELRNPTAEALPGSALHATLRPYQEEGVRWLGFLNRLGLGACLADDMGLGKTIQVLSLFLVIRGRASGPHLLVAPASLLGNWRAEAARFAPSLKLRVAHSSGDGTDEDGVDDADVVLTTYGTVTTTEWLRKRRWDTVVLDEAQAIKNPGAKQTRAVQSLDARVRIALTGTPVENRAGDLWSIFHFLQPGLLGSAAQFRSFTKASEGARNPWAPIRALVRPYLLRRLKTDPAVAPDLPAKTEMNVTCGLSREQVALYQRAVDELAATLADTDGMGRRGAILASLLRLKQICNHPAHWLADGRWELARSGKLQRLAELVESIVERQEKLLVFSQFREAVDPLAARLGELFGRPGLVLHGGTAIKERQLLVDRFQRDDAVPFLVLSLKAGGTGLNLTAATHVIHYDRWWNPAVEEQATDRAFRIGQRKPVFVHKMVCRGTVEERVDAMLVQKRALAKELLSGEEEVRLTEMSNEEIMRMVSLDLRQVSVD